MQNSSNLSNKQQENGGGVAICLPFKVDVKVETKYRSNANTKLRGEMNQSFNKESETQANMRELPVAEIKKK